MYADGHRSTVESVPLQKLPAAMGHTEESTGRLGGRLHSA
jgi:hypothetical protein